jgi:3-hydroxybenzoate 6-monooxygenase
MGARRAPSWKDREKRVAGDLPILVIGAGLGGAAAALGLARKGFRVQLVEEAAELGVIGYGIQLGPNVFPMFRALGVEKAVLAKSHFPPEVLMYDALTGERVTGFATGEAFRSRFGDPYVAIHRVDLHMCLLDACRELKNVEILPGAACKSITDNGDAVEVTLADGRTLKGSALIGADGLGSTVRRHLVGEEKPTPIGYVAHRTIVPMELAPARARSKNVILWGGPGFHIVQYPLRDETLFNIVAVFRTENIYERADETAYREVLTKTYASAHPIMHDILAMMDLKRRWVLADRTPIRRWSQGRVTLLGDAAHPTLQSYAQGACMAIEDSVVLARCIELAQGDFAAAYARYEKERVLRTARVVLDSRLLWEFYHLGGIARDVRNDAESRKTEADMFGCLAWLYDGVKVPDAL